MYEYLFDKAWRHTGDDATWIDAYADSHAGCEDADFRGAWRWMLDSVYVDCARLGQGTVTNSRPSLRGVIRWTQPGNSTTTPGCAVPGDGCFVPKDTVRCTTSIW